MKSGNISIEMAYIPLWPKNYSGDSFDLPKEKNVFFYEFMTTTSVINSMQLKDIKPCPDDEDQIRFWTENLKQYFPRREDKHLCIVPWGHSFGYGIFQELVARSKDSISFTLDFINDNPEKSDIFKKFGWKKIWLDKNFTLKFYRHFKFLNSILRYEELAQILISVYGLKGTDILLIHACQITNLYNLYALRDVSNTMVAPQSDIGIPGYNFPELFKMIENDEITGNQTLYKAIVHTFGEHENERRFYIKEIEETGLYAFDSSIWISFTEILKTLVENLELFLKKNENDLTVKERLITARINVNQFSGGPYFFQIDIIKWVENLMHSFPKESFIENAFLLLNEEIKNKILFSYKGKRISGYNNLPYNRIDDFDTYPKGISIHYPIEVSADDDIDNIFVIEEPVSFVQNNLWWVNFYKNHPIPVE